MMARKNEFFHGQEFLDTCRKIKNYVETRCAGFLEFVVTTGHVERFGGKLDGNDPRLLKVDFVHRTARDFLLTKPEGRNILTQCDLETVYLAIFRSFLIDIQLDNSKGPRGWSWTDFGIRIEGFISGGTSFTTASDRRISYAMRCCKLWQEHLDSFQWSKTTGTLWQEHSTRMYELLEQACEDAGNFLEQIIASLGYAQPIVRATSASFKDHTSLAIYLFWQTMPFSFDDIWFQTMSSERCDFDWGYLHTARLSFQMIPIIATILESLAFVSLYSMSRHSRKLGFPQWKKRKEWSVHELASMIPHHEYRWKNRKILVPVTLFNNRCQFGWIMEGVMLSFIPEPEHSVSIAGQTSRQETCDIISDLIIEMNMAQIVNNFVLR
jgi:hypothetical protein